MAELRHARDAIIGADLVELRIDTVSDPDVAGALANRRVPVIVTCRPLWEGGRFKGSEEERKRLLGHAIELGVEFVDIEWRAGFVDLIARTDGRRIVLSSHEFDRMPDDLEQRSRVMCSTGAEVIKIAATVHGLSDCLRFRSLTEELTAAQKHVWIGMGEAGDVTRILAARFGSAWTYAGDLAGIGQVTTSRLLAAFRFADISDSTEIYGVVGRGDQRFVLPAMINAGFAAIGRDAVCLPLAPANSDDLSEFSRSVALKGAVLSFPRPEIADDNLLVSATAEQVRLWTGVQVPVEVFRATLLAFRSF
jgi:3-dehydroquinate dehydratase/shikimate dehydrogenase